MGLIVRFRYVHQAFSDPMRILTTLNARLATSITVTLLALLSMSSLYAADAIRVRVTNFAPNYYVKDGHWTGLDVELAAAVVSEAGYSIDYVDLPWSRALAYLQDGSLDMMMNLSKTPDREAVMSFIGPERLSRRALVVRRDDLAMPIENLDQLVAQAKLKHLTFGIQADAKYSDEFDARMLSDPEFASHFDSVTQGALLAKKTQAGRNLGFFEDYYYAAYQLKNSPDFRGLAIHPYIISSAPTYFGISKKLDPIKEKKLSDACERLEKNGTLDKIRARWQGGT
jgi:polar amino acid transport system substrate-binding protein